MSWKRKQKVMTARIGAVFPIKIYLYTPGGTSSGGTTDGYGAPINDFAEVKDGAYNKYFGVEGSGQTQVKTFRIHQRDSLALNRKSKIELDGVSYTILTIQKEDNRNLKWIVEAKVKV